MSRISVEEAAQLWHEASDDELRELAHAERARTITRTFVSDPVTQGKLPATMAL